MKVLVVEDSDRLRNALGEGLRRSGFVVDLAEEGRTGLGYATSNEYDVIVLDIMMPKLDGFGLLREVREWKNPAKVLVLSAKGDINDRVKGLESGADDYLVKPFAFEELVARIRTLARRRLAEGSPVMNVGALTIDSARRAIIVAGEEIGFTASEYNLIEHLSLRRGTVVPKSKLRDMLSQSDSESVSNTIEVLISNIRKKLRGVGVENLIQTKRGFGYYIE